MRPTPRLDASTPFVRRRIARLLAALGLAAAVTASAQELPGTPSGDLPPTLRSPYPGAPQRQAPPAPAQPAPAQPPLAQPPGAPPPRIIVIPRPEPPTFILVPDLRVSGGYSDNIFITPDNLAFRTVSDGLFVVSPRFRALVRLSQSFGLVGDYAFNYTQFLSHGNATQNGGSVFLGYRPAPSEHVELGVRGGLADVSEFEESNLREGHVFLSGTYPLAPMLESSVTASVGIRNFPDRTRIRSQALVLGIGPLQIPLGTTTSTERGEDEMVSNFGGALSLVYASTGLVRLGYDYTRNDADFSQLDYDTHRLSLAAINAWTSWLATQAAYSLSSRRFDSAVSDTTSSTRRDSIHEITLTARLTPAFLSSPWFLRSGAVRIDYGLLLDRSNLASGELDRNYVSIGLELGFLPFTGEQIGRRIFPWMYGMPDSKSFSG